MLGSDTNTKLLIFFITILFFGAGFIPIIIGNQTYEKIDSCAYNILSLKKPIATSKIFEFESFNEEKTSEPLEVMRPDLRTLDKWIEDYNDAEMAFIDPNLEQEIQKTESYSILDHLNYGSVEPYETIIFKKDSYGNINSFQKGFNEYFKKPWFKTFIFKLYARLLLPIILLIVLIIIFII